MLASPSSPGKLKLSVVEVISRFPVHFQAPWELPKALKTPGTPPWFESTAKKLRAPSSVISEQDAKLPFWEIVIKYVPVTSLPQFALLYPLQVGLLPGVDSGHPEC